MCGLGLIRLHMETAALSTGPCSSVSKFLVRLLHLLQRVFFTSNSSRVSPRYLSLWVCLARCDLVGIKVTFRVFHACVFGGGGVTDKKIICVTSSSFHILHTVYGTEGDKVFVSGFGQISRDVQVCRIFERNAVSCVPQRRCFRTHCLRPPARLVLFEVCSP